MSPSCQAPPLIRIKRYARSRLYYAAERRYVSLEELLAWAERGVPFVVIDAATKEDVTAAVLS